MQETIPAYVDQTPSVLRLHVASRCLERIADPAAGLAEDNLSGIRGFAVRPQAEDGRHDRRR
jgi:phosphate uptake regulator